MGYQKIRYCDRCGIDLDGTSKPVTFELPPGTLAITDWEIDLCHPCVLVVAQKCIHSLSAKDLRDILVLFEWKRAAG